MIKALISYVLILAVLSLSLTPAYAANLCERPQGGYTVLFFNGVWNTPYEANLSMEELRYVAGNSYNSESVNYSLMYNTTGNEAGETMFQDIAEVFIQRGEELGFDPVRHFHIFREAATGNSTGFLDAITNIIGAAGQAVLDATNELYAYVSGKTVAAVAELVSEPPTLANYSTHATMLSRLSIEGEKIMMVAHSQGNLFMNVAYEKALTYDNITEQNVAALHVAPASVNLSGDHVLADIDLIINGLRTLGVNAIPDITVELPVSHLLTDASGHTFVGTYLEPSLAALTQVKSKFDSAMASLVPPESTASIGAFTATLNWSTPGDVDLHIFEPNGQHVYYSNRQGFVGYLDKDDIVGDGPEHYYASCDSELLEEGVYTFAINNFGAPAGVIATLQISTPQLDDVKTASITLGSARGSSGNASPAQLINVSVTKDADGKVSLNAI
jgi:hypothetical protein